MKTCKRCAGPIGEHQYCHDCLYNMAYDTGVMSSSMNKWRTDDNYEFWESKIDVAGEEARQWDRYLKYIKRDKVNEKDTS